jgi:hypothetical protein
MTLSRQARSCGARALRAASSDFLKCDFSDMVDWCPDAIPVASRAIGRAILDDPENDQK